MRRMTGIDQLLVVAHAFGEAAELPETTVSWRVFGDTKKLPRLKAGADLQTRRLERAMRWFSTNWPEGHAWPDGVPRSIAAPEHRAEVF